MISDQRGWARWFQWASSSIACSINNWCQLMTLPSIGQVVSPWWHVHCDTSISSLSCLSHWCRSQLYRPTELRLKRKMMFMDRSRKKRMPTASETSWLTSRTSRAQIRQQRSWGQNLTRRNVTGGGHVGLVGTGKKNFRQKHWHDYNKQNETNILKENISK